MTILLERAWDILVQNRRAYIAFNALYYGLMLVFMVYVNFNPALHESILKQYNGAFMIGPLAVNPPEGLELLKSAAKTFLLNVLGSSYTEISLPSFILPFSGIAISLYRAAVQGIFFSPSDPSIARIFIPHLPTLLLEGQAAVLAMLGAYVHGRGLIWPETIGQQSRWRAYIEGVRQSGTLYMLVMPILLISAIYGIIETAALVVR